MSRLTRFMAAAALLAVPLINACGDDLPPPPPTGSIDGLVSVESQGVDGVSVTLSNGASATTANGGMYRFDGIEAGTYTLTISNYPDDASFDQTSLPATIATDGETITVNFSGTYIRTSSIMGTVTVEDDGLAGITVTLSGVSDSETLTDANGQYAFAGLRAGNYTVEITGFDDEDVAFGSTSSAATVAVGESKVVTFEGTYLRASEIRGQVTADGQPQEGITVSLQGRGENQAAQTNSAGQFSFDQLRRGNYSVGISGYDTDEMSFDETTQSVTVAYGETASVPFEGTLLRTAGIEGTVSVEGVGPISGVTVNISGEGESDTGITDNVGVYSFEGLPAGNYSVVISGFDDDEYGFPDGTTATVTVALQQTGTVPFNGLMLRTAAIEGTVTVGDNDAPLAGVTVTIEGGPKDEDHEATTNSSGQYMIDRLHAGEYSVSISGYDANEYGFEPTTESVTVGLRETGEVAFQGQLLRTAGVTGRVHVGGAGMAGITVKLTGPETREGNTNADGQYGFAGLAAGDYTATISGWDDVEYAFAEPAQGFSLELDESKTGVNFEGKSLRTAAVMGTVKVEGTGLSGVTVTLLKITGTTSGTLVGSMPTGSDGTYAFGDLLTSTYRVSITDNTDEHDYSGGDYAKEWTGIVATDQTMTVDFNATIIRTASIGGMVTLDNEAKPGVTVTLTGGEQTEDGTAMTTGADGMYGFTGLRKGNYTVTMTNPDEDKYSYPTTSRSMNLSVGQKQTGISFAGASLRQASISGQVHAERDGVPDVTVTLSGKEDGTATTDDNGEYNFSGLAGGTYTIEISGWDTAAYEFPSASTTQVVKLGDDEAAIEDFAGMHTRTAGISGMLFLDEVNSDDEHTTGEPMLDLSAEIAALVKAKVIPATVTGIPLILRGPKLDDEHLGMANADGTYSFTGLRAGDYRVGVAIDRKVNDSGLTVGDLLSRAGYRFSGEDSEVSVNVAAAATTTVDFPFEITMQTITVTAAMGNDSVTGDMVGGVTLALYATGDDADDGINPLGTSITDSTGMAKFDFARDKNLGPGGHGTDHLVFAKVTKTGHDDLRVSDNANIEILYPRIERRSRATIGARLLNRRVNFQWWVKSVAGKKDGDQFLPHWKVVIGADTIATDAKGKGMHSDTVDVTKLPLKYTIAVDSTQVDSLTTMGEMWTQSKALTHEHDGMALPADNMAADNDLGPIHITYKTQSLVIGVYRETDGVPGFTNYQSGVVGGDHRPVAAVAGKMSVELLARDDRNRLKRYKWDPDQDPKTDNDRDGIGTVGADGLKTFTRIPAGAELTVRFHVGDYRTAVGVDYDDEIETFGRDLDLGMTVGSFGEMSGAVPEVRMCTASTKTTDDECSTFAYQWTTGRLSGNIDDVNGLWVKLTPGTEDFEVLPDSMRTRTMSEIAGRYSFSGVQDGAYTATARGNADYSIVGKADKPVSVFHDERDAEDETGVDTLYVGTSKQATATWTTTRQGLAIMGYVANDSDDNGLVRKDEAVAGMTVKLLTNARFVRTGPNAGKLSSAKTVKTTETESDGLYSFDDLNDATDYWVQVVASADHGGYRGLSLKNPNLSDKLAAARYPAIADVDTPDNFLPRWDRTSDKIVAGTDKVLITDNKGTTTVDDDVSATLQNFALVYRDGTLAGSVDNLSGSNAGINLRVYGPTATDERETTTTGVRTGSFEVPNILEGEYTVEIDQARYEAPCLDEEGGKPDDDGPMTDDECDFQAVTELSATVEGRGDYASMGTLVIYSTRPGLVDDELAELEIEGVQTVGDTAVDLASGVTLPTEQDNDDGEDELTGGTLAEPVIYTPGTITIDAEVSDGARTDLEAESDGTGEKCSGSTCTLGFHKTGTSSAGTAVSTTITMTVTAANGYNDHEFTFDVTRAAPVGNVLDGLAVDDGVAGNSDDVADSDGETTSWTHSIDSTATSVELVFDFATVDNTAGPNDGDAAWCQTATVTDGGTKVKPENRGRGDECDGMRFDVDAPAAGQSKTLTLKVKSQDNVERTISLTITRPSPA